MNKKIEQNNKVTIPPGRNVVQQPYAVVIDTMAGIRVSLLNSANPATAGDDIEKELKPGDELRAVFGFDDAFVDNLSQFSAKHAPAYGQTAPKGDGAIPFLVISRQPGDADVDTVLVVAASAAEAENKAYAASRNEPVVTLSLERDVLKTMKEFLHDGQPTDIKIM